MGRSTDWKSCNRYGSFLVPSVSRVRILISGTRLSCSLSNAAQRSSSPVPPGDGRRWRSTKLPHGVRHAHRTQCVHRISEYTTRRRLFLKTFRSFQFAQQLSSIRGDWRLPDQSVIVLLTARAIWFPSIECEEKDIIRTTSSSLLMPNRSALFTTEADNYYSYCQSLCRIIHSVLGLWWPWYYLPDAILIHPFKHAYFLTISNALVLGNRRPIGTLFLLEDDLVDA